MGGNMSRVVGCFAPHDHPDKVAVFLSEPFDEGLGHSFCYVRPVSAPSLPHYECEGEPGNLSYGGPRPNSLHADNGTCKQDHHRIRSALETSFKSISGASVSANTSTPRTITSCDQFSSFANVSHDRAAAFEATPSFSSLPLQPVPRGLSQSGPISGSTMGQTFDRAFLSGPIERGFLSGPLERAFLSGPLDRACVSAPMEATDRSLYSAPLTSTSYYAAYFRRRRRSLAHVVKNLGYPVKKALSRSLSKTSLSLAKAQRSLYAPVRLLQGLGKDTARDGSSQCDCRLDSGYTSSSSDTYECHNLQWAQGKAGEDRMHVVLSEEHGWLFVGIYDGFSGPDAPEFLMSNLYKEVYKELRGLLWDAEEISLSQEDATRREDSKEKQCMQEPLKSSNGGENDCVFTESQQDEDSKEKQCMQEPLKSSNGGENDCVFTISQQDEELSRCNNECAQLDGNIHHLNSGSTEVLCDNTRNIWFNEQKDVFGPNFCRGCSAGGSSNQMEVMDAALQGQDVCQSTMMKNTKEVHKNEKDALNGKQRRIWFGRSFPELELKRAARRGKGQNKQCLSNLEYEQDPKGKGKRPEESHKMDKARLLKNGVADHSDVLNALWSALENTERMFLQMADHSLKEMPELALMGSCVLVMLMKGEDVYVMNVGDSRAIVAQMKADSKAHARGLTYDGEKIGARDTQLRQELERIMEETPTELETFESSHTRSSSGPPATSLLLNAVQLTADHSTNVEEEVLRIQSEHPEDKKSIANERVKGRLKVTRAFGAGFLKSPRWNNSLLEMFQVDYVGMAPYINCMPALRHHSLGPHDRFLVLSSDGLYQYLSNEEVVSQVEWFMENYPDGDPAQYLIEELLFRAAKKAGMDFHELLDIPQGDRRKYHDDVSVMVISLEGRIWRSFG